MIQAATRSLSHTPPTALFLGLGGLIPFVVLSTSLPFLNSELAHKATFALMAYGAVILSFLGGLHWGLAAPSLVADDGRGEWAAPRHQLILSVVPSLVAWVGVALWNSPAGLIVLAGGFLLALVMDRRASHAPQYPAWMLDLRILLTLVVMTSLLIAALVRLLPVLP